MKVAAQLQEGVLVPDLLRAAAGGSHGGRMAGAGGRHHRCSGRLAGCRPAGRWASCRVADWHPHIARSCLLELLGAYIELARMSRRCAGEQPV